MSCHDFGGRSDLNHSYRGQDLKLEPVAGGIECQERCGWWAGVEGSELIGKCLGC